MNSFNSILYLTLLCLLVVGCSSTSRKAESLIIEEEWLSAVIEYRKGYSLHPDDVEIKSRLKQAESNAADYYYQKGRELVVKGDVDAAIVQYQQGLIAMPEHSKLTQAMMKLISIKEANVLYEDAVNNLRDGRVQDAKKLLTQALARYPDHENSNKALNEINLQEEKEKESDVALTSKEPITLSFRKTDIKTAFEFVAKSFGVNVIFDEAVKSVPITLFAQDITFLQALNLMLSTTKTFYKKIGDNTILIAPDTDVKRGQYEDYSIKAFYLRTIGAKKMANIISGVLKLNKVVVNEEMNLIMIRDNEEVLSLVNKLIELNDRKPAELLLEVEILEVNRSKAEQLGLNFGSQITKSFPENVTAFSNGIIQIPNFTLTYFKQDVDAKTLANPKIRVINRKKAQIHIGDRVPLRSSTIIDATGQTRTTYEYKDLGISLIVTPDIHLDNSTTIQLQLEVSTLGQNLGTQNEPAYSIGTRNAETQMLLRDGETAILGGLIRDEERRARIKIPGLGDIPLIGALFTTYDDQVTRTDILLTITTRVVRPWDIPSSDTHKIFSGTQNNYSSKPVFSYLSEPHITTAPSVVKNEPKYKKSLTKNNVTPSNNIVLSFDMPTYNVALGGDVNVGLIGENFSELADVPIEVLFNSQVLSFVSASPGELGAGRFEVTSEAGQGSMNIKLSGLIDGSESKKNILGYIKLKSEKPGISYLVYKTPNFTTKSGEDVHAEVRASRVIVK